MPPETLVLAFDTSAAHCAAALLSGSRLLDARCEEMATGQAERLMPLLEQILQARGLDWRDLSAIGVGTGPGNFTGVRIAVAAARGLALGLGIPAIGVTRFQAMALDAPRPTVATLDARRDELYLQAFDDGAEHPAQLVRTGAETDLPPAATFVGHAAEDLAARHGGQAIPPRRPLAEAIARIAAAQLDHSAPRPSPFYLRGADAAPSSDPPPVILP